MTLKCPRVGRDRDNICALQFYFSRPVTDDEMRFLHDVMRRAVACAPKLPAAIGGPSLLRQPVTFKAQPIIEPATPSRSSCDVCGAEDRPTATVIVYGTESNVCDKCRGDA